MLATVALVTWSANAALGLSMLLRWRTAPRTAYVHLATASLGLVVWIFYLLDGRPAWLAWAVFVWLNLVNALGDVLLVAGSRRRTAEVRATGVRAYLSAVRGVLTSRSPVRVGHATLGGATYFVTLLVAVGV